MMIAGGSRILCFVEIKKADTLSAFYKTIFIFQT
jgi:hypothetical protein